MNEDDIVVETGVEDDYDNTPSEDEEYGDFE